MPDEVSGLSVRIKANIDQFNRALDEAASKATATAAKIEAAFMKTNNVMGKMGGTLLKGMLGDAEALGGRIPFLTSSLTSFGVAGVAAAASVGFAFHEMTSALDFAENIRHQAELVGLSTDKLQEYHFMAMKAGVSTQAMDGALESLNARLGMAGSGITRYLQPFQMLFGKTFTKESAKQMQENGNALELIAKRMNQLNIAGKTGAASRLGLEGIRPLLDQIGEGYANGVDLVKEWTAEAHRLGFVMDADLIKRAADLKIQWDILNKTISIEMYDAILSLAPAFMQLMKWIKEAADRIGDIVSAFQTVQEMSDRQLDRNIQRNNARIQQLRGQGIIPLKPQQEFIENWTPERGAAAVPEWASRYLKREAGRTAFSMLGLSGAGLEPEPSPLLKPGTPGGIPLTPGEELYLLETSNQKAVIERANRVNADYLASLKKKKEEAGKQSAADVSKDKKGGRDRTQEQIDTTAQQIAKDQKEMVQTLGSNLASLVQRSALSLLSLEAERSIRTAELDKMVATKRITDTQRQEIAARDQQVYEVKKSALQQQVSTEFETAMLDIQDNEFATVEERNRISTRRLEIERENNDKMLELAVQFGVFSQAEADLIAQKQSELDEAKKAVTSERNLNALREREYDLHTDLLNAQREVLQAQAPLLNIAGRQQNALAQLQLQRQEEWEDLKKKFELPEYKGFPERQQPLIDAFNQKYMYQQQNVLRETAGPLDQYIMKINQVDEAAQQAAVNGLQALEDGLVDAIVNAKSLGDVARNVFKQIASDLARMVIQQTITGPLAKSLSGMMGGNEGGGGFFGFLGGLMGGGFNPTPIPNFLNIPDVYMAQSGARSAPGGLTLVGEKGPELMIVPGGAQVVPNDQMWSWLLEHFVHQFASGTKSAPGGLSVVGEKGPELINIPRGAEVVPSDKIREWLIHHFNFHAMGTMFAPGGLSVVGEKGPEILSIPYKSQDVSSDSIANKIINLSNLAQSQIAQSSVNGFNTTNVSTVAPVTQTNFESDVDYASNRLSIVGEKGTIFKFPQSQIVVSNNFETNASNIKPIEIGKNIEFRTVEPIVHIGGDLIKLSQEAISDLPIKSEKIPHNAQTIQNSEIYERLLTSSILNARELRNKELRDKILEDTAAQYVRDKTLKDVIIQYDIERNASSSRDTTARETSRDISREVTRDFYKTKEFNDKILKSIVIQKDSTRDISFHDIISAQDAFSLRDISSKEFYKNNEIRDKLFNVKDISDQILFRNITNITSNDELWGWLLERLSHFALGTNNAPGGLSVVGEKGPEIMNVPRGAQIIPNNRIENWIFNKFPKYAFGTDFASGGLSIVGERGPELLNTALGLQIPPNTVVGSYMGGASNIVFDLRGAVVTEDLLRQMNEISARNTILGAQVTRTITKNDIDRQSRRSLS